MVRLFYCDCIAMPQFIIEAGILAGGKATRLGGQDKGLIRFHDKALCQHVADALSPYSKRVLISANRHLADYRKVSPHVHTDSIPDIGPLGGIASLLSQTKADYLLLSPCDTPLLDSCYAERMLSGLEQHGSTLLFVASHKNKLQPLHILVHQSLSASLSLFIASGERKVANWIASEAHKIISFSETETMFTNLNSPNDFLLSEQKTSDQ